MTPQPAAELSDAQATVVRAAEDLLAAGRPHEGIDLLDAEQRAGGDPALARELVRLRHRAFAVLDRSRELGPRADSDRHDPPVPGEIPTSGASALTVDGLRRGLTTHGCLWLRGLLTPQRVEELRNGIDSTFDAFDRVQAGGDPHDAQRWFSPFEPDPEYAEFRVGGRRKWSRHSGSVWTADSPEMLARLTRTLTEIGIADVVEAHLGERPALSVNKCSLRRVPVDSGGEWHQDGAFLGEKVRTVNVWIALDDCGTDAPGMDVVPKRVGRIVPCGTEGAVFDWSVAADEVAAAAGNSPVVRPEFRAGDILLFDQFFLHRTASDPGMTHERRAIECWFFAPSAYPDEQIPMAF